MPDLIDRLNEALTEERQIWLYDVDQATFVRLTLDGRSNTQSEWLGDRTVVYLSDQGEEPGALYVQGIEDREAREFLRIDREILHFDLGGPGGPVALTVAGESGARDLVWARPGEGGVGGGIAATRFDEYAGDVSPDGRWVAYLSDESGRVEVYVSPFPEGGTWGAGSSC